MRNKEETQQKIINAAILVFNEDFSASLEKVAEKALVTRRTLHRYFKDREELLVRCEEAMQRNCKRAMDAALESSAIPLKKLERMLYAAIDCGVEYAFFQKIHHRDGHKHDANNQGCATYESINNRCRQLILQLQEEGFISKRLTVDWVLVFLGGVVATTVSMALLNNIAEISLREYAWFSFSKGVGV
ncbi:TetR/AcrR family transcriptional regulator [Olivibacter sp. CPCC 100613]|uniref:TetR/AcrR family transcriptional regulator n=1 Tax=Olivibacter sp. CPCC 100613 TaxID=3079931 RepID=UPI002FFA82CC